MALLFLSQYIPKLVRACKIRDTYFPVFHPFELGLIQSYPLPDEGRTCCQKVILLIINVCGGETIKNTILKNYNDRLTDKGHPDLSLIPAGKGAVRFWLPLILDPPM